MLEFNNLLSDIGAAALLGAAILCLTRGRYAERPDITLVGLGLLALAPMRGLLGDLRKPAIIGSSMPLLNVVVLAGGTAIAIAAMYAATRTRQARPRQTRTTQTAYAIAIGGVAAVAVTVSVALRGTDLDGLGQTVLIAVATAGWLTVTWRHSRMTRHVTSWLPSALLLTTASSAARVPALLAPTTALLLLPGVLALAGATIAVTGSMLDLRELVVDQRERAARGLEQERLHDVRSVLAGLQLATASLSTYEDKIAPPQRRRLQQSVAAELVRLRQLVDPSPSANAVNEPVTTVSLESVIRPVLDAHQGTFLSADIEDVPVLARPSELSAIVGALLDNARLHAGGAVVELRTSHIGRALALEVRDFGPGVHPSETAAVFERGRRGVRSVRDAIPGSGLGLYLARQRARAMGGDLTLHLPRGGGAAFVLTVPVAVDDATLATVHWMPGLSWLGSARVRESAGA